jgi:hypothetical protein
LIYLDPPFNSDRVYNLVYYNKTTNSTAQQKAFHDMWTPSAQTQLMFEQFSDELKSNNSLDGNVCKFLEAWMGMGMGALKEGKDKWGKVVFSVKTGKQCQPSFLDELEGVVLKQQAHFGVLILDKDASFNMQTRVEGSRKIKYHYAKDMPPQEFGYLQIYTAREILEGAKLLVPPSIIAVKNYRKAQLELFQAQTN